jgi:hypothetical protein
MRCCTEEGLGDDDWRVNDQERTQVRGFPSVVLYERLSTAVAIDDELEARHQQVVLLLLAHLALQSGGVRCVR